MAQPTQGKILIADDQPSIRRTLRATLGAMQFATEEAQSGEEAIALASRAAPDAVLLDVNMPGMGGIETCRALRKAHAHLSILMLTVRDGVESKVQALDAGADDYITKPFDLLELAARLRAAVRRARASASPSEAAVIRIDALELHLEKRQLTKSGAVIRLTPKEFDLLKYLMEHAGVPIPHTRLLRAVWGPEYGNELEYLRTFMRQLRKKIEDDAAQPRYLMTDPYVGYRFCEPLTTSTTAPQ